VRRQAPARRCGHRGGRDWTSRCNYGRLCGSLTVRGRDVGLILIGEGLACPHICSGARCPAAAAVVQVRGVIEMAPLHRWGWGLNSDGAGDGASFAPALEIDRNPDPLNLQL
jgi:hypothetical protein